MLRRVLLFAVALSLLTAILSTIPRLSPFGGMISAPSSRDGMVSISTSPDGSRTFVTYAPYKPSVLRRLFHSSLMGAFVVQHNNGSNVSITHSGKAHIDFQGDLLSVRFEDSAQFIFTTKPKGALPPELKNVDYAMGLASYHLPRTDSHAAFVASRDWAKNSCAL